MKKPLPLVTVIIPTYNRVRTIARAVRSIIDQTYQNIEIIVVDDGSTDDTRKSLAVFGDGITYIYKQNGGVSSARNLGLKYASGEYIAFLDSDDMSLPGKIGTMVNRLMALPDFGAGISEVESVDGQGRCISRSQYRKHIPEDGYILKYLLQYMHVAPGSGMVIRKIVLDDVGSFDESLSTAEDIDLILRIASRYKIFLVDDPLQQCEKLQSSLSKALFTGNRLRALSKMERYAPDFVRDNKNLFDEVVSKVHISYARDLLWNRHWMEARNELKESMKTKMTAVAFMLYAKSILVQTLGTVIPGRKKAP